MTAIPYRTRFARPEDAEPICRIYNQGIVDRLATLETELRTPDERRQWMATRSPRHPVIVAELTEPGPTHSRPPTVQGGIADPVTKDTAIILGWGSLNVFNPREAYRYVADLSVYVERDWRGRGVGNVLLSRLIELAREHGFHKLVLSAFPKNAGGMALYTKQGFRTVGVYKEQGRLDGEWVDTVIMEKLL